MAKKTLTSGLLGTVTGLSKDEPEVSTVAASDIQHGDENFNKEIVDRRRPGRPKAGGGEFEVNVTFKLPDSLVQDVRMLAVVERTTQKEIVIAALRKYLVDKSNNK